MRRASTSTGREPGLRRRPAEANVPESAFQDDAENLRPVPGPAKACENAAGVGCEVVATSPALSRR
jgi:hypothetical protein